MDRDAALTAAQRRVVTDLMARDQPRPTFPSGLGDDLRDQLDEALAPLADALAEPLWVSKNALAQVHACESNYLAEQDWKGWNASTAQGEVTHRAIQLSVALDGDTTPRELVDHALDDLAADDAGSLSSYLRQLSPAARGELRARASNAVSTFLECWPPLPASWWPRTELPVRTDLCGGRIVLSGKIDLSLGHAVGAEARCLFVDLKTGGHYPAHLDDLRFYALIQGLRIGVPPFRVASYYLDSASFAAEDVTAETLDIAIRRTVDGVRKMIEVRAGQRPATITPCPRCRYCRIRAECEGARAWERRDQDSESTG
jgi:hypothetical protein